MPRYSLIAFVIVCLLCLGAVRVDWSGSQPVDQAASFDPPAWDPPTAGDGELSAGEPEVDLRMEPGDRVLRRLPPTTRPALPTSESVVAQEAQPERAPAEVRRLPAIVADDDIGRPSDDLSRDDEFPPQDEGNPSGGLEFPVAERTAESAESRRQVADLQPPSPDPAFEMPLDEPEVDQPVTDQPVVQEFVTDQPAVQEYVVNEPGVDTSSLPDFAGPDNDAPAESRRWVASVPESSHEGFESPRDELELEMRPSISPSSIREVDLPQQVSVRAGAMLREASQLADRGALFAARDQFLRVMRMICQSLDSKIERPLHTRALANGLRALEEADDFALSGETAESDLHVQGFVEGHRTSILKGALDDNLTSLQAMQRYYKYAYEQLSLAGGKEPVASQALFSLGRIEALLSERQGLASGGGPKALALYHAALTADANNGKAANELGVLLARRGRLTDARNVLRQATRTATDATALRNLAVVHQQLGNRTAAEQMAQQAAVVAAHTSPDLRTHRGGVQWVDPVSFAQAGDRSAMPLGQLPLRPDVSAPPRAAFPTAGTPVARQPSVRTARQDSGVWAF